MRKEIVLPPHLYDRIKASAGEHGGIGAGECFTRQGFPLCAHGHVWRSYREFDASPSVEAPELKPFLSYEENDIAVEEALDTEIFSENNRIPFDAWCRILNVKRGVEARVEVEVPA